MGLAALAAVALIGSKTRGEPPQSPNQPGTTLLAQVDSQGLAALAWAGGTGSGWGAASSLAVVLAGGEDHFRVWSLEGPWNGPRGWKIRAVGGILGAAFLDTGPAGVSAWIQAGQFFDLWTITDPLFVKPIPPTLLAQVRDDRAIPTALVDDLEVEAYWQTILAAASTGPEAFARANQPQLTRADLMNQPVRNRGKVVQVKGRLVRLRRLEPSIMASQAGIPVIYEGWVITEAYGANPTCVLVVDLLPGLMPAETMDQDVRVEGYFFKRYRYQSAGPGPDGSPYRLAPLVIGRAFRLDNPPVAESFQEHLWVGKLLPWLLVIVASSAASVALLTFWFHRRDEAIRKRIRQLRSASMEAFLATGQSWPEPPVVLTTEENEQRNRRWTKPSDN